MLRESRQSQKLWTTSKSISTVSPIELFDGLFCKLQHGHARLVLLNYIQKQAKSCKAMRVVRKRAPDSAQGWALAGYCSNRTRLNFSSKFFAATTFMAKFETVRCNLCGSDDSELIITSFDRLHPQNVGVFKMVRCKSCGLVFQNPRPTQETIGEYYPKAYYSFKSADSFFLRSLEAAILNTYGSKKDKVRAFYGILSRQGQKRAFSESLQGAQVQGW